MTWQVMFPPLACKIFLTGLCTLKIYYTKKSECSCHSTCNGIYWSSKASLWAIYISKRWKDMINLRFITVTLYTYKLATKFGLWKRVQLPLLYKMTVCNVRSCISMSSCTKQWQASIFVSMTPIKRQQRPLPYYPSWKSITITMPTWNNVAVYV